jgi:hypothetical protein
MVGLYNARRTIIDDPVNSVIIARFGAFVGEISWGIQIAWALRVIARHVPMRGSERTKKILRTVIPVVSYFMAACAIVANIMSVVGMVTTNYIFPTVEEALWGCMFFAGAICALCLWHWGCDSFSFDWGSNW